MTMLDVPGYSINLDEAIRTIKRKGYTKVAVQIPEGLKKDVFKIVDFLEKETESDVIISGDPCFGACDLANCKLKSVGVEFIIHIGHLCIPVVESLGAPIVFVNASSQREISHVVEKSLAFLEGKKIGIVTTAQHIHLLNVAEDILKENNFEPFISHGDERISEKGLILGCNFSAGTKILDKVDSFLFIGSGTFHPLGLLLASKKPVVAADPYTNKVMREELNELKDMVLRQRYAAIARSKESMEFGILLCVKPGQQRINLVYKVKETLEVFNKKSYVIALEDLSPTLLQGFTGIDCFVNTGCPRVAIDDYLRYPKPIITPVELEVALGKRKWENYLFDQILQPETAL
jgi:2-(3-amino-3-carboxypropyl)histidine synthase